MNINQHNIKNLKLLFMLRNIAICGQIIAIFIVTNFLQIPLVTKPLYGIIAILFVINMMTFARTQKQNNISELEFFVQLLIDVTALFGLLYFTGGATNPFACLFILQVIIAAVLLKPVYTWSIATLTIVLYTILMFWSVEVPYFMHHHIGDFFSLHVQGMWISFILLAGIIAWFIVGMNQTIAKQNSLLKEAENMASLGTLATNAAHELGTPLATMAVLAEELDSKNRSKFSNQIARCKDIISYIAAAGGVNRAESGSKMPIKTFLDETTKQWLDKQPKAKLTIEISGNNNPVVIAEASLRQALFNLLDNAYIASPAFISFKANWNSNKLTITIEDQGDGIPKNIKDTIGQAGVTTRTNGMGLGIFLAKSVILRLDGQFSIKNRTQGGASCNIIIPLKSIAL